MLVYITMTTYDVVDDDVIRRRQRRRDDDDDDDYDNNSTHLTATRVSQYQNVSILDSSKDDGGGTDNWSYRRTVSE